MDSLDVIRFGPYEIRPATRELFKHGIRVKLPPQAFEVLRVLVERQDKLVTRQEFHSVLWPADTFVDFNQGLNNAIKKIREVLNDSAETPRYVETLPRLGYRFVGQVEFQKQNGAHTPGNSNGSTTLAPAALETEDNGKAAAAPAALDSQVNRSPMWLLAIPLVIVFLTVGWLFRPHYPPPRIIDEVQLTSDGIPKWGIVATDGLRVYFTERLNGRMMIAAVPVSGGQTVPLRMPFEQTELLGISSDRTDLLVAETDNLFRDAPLWRVPILGGTPRRLGNVFAHDASWSRDGNKLVYMNGSVVYLAKADGSDPRVIAPARGDQFLLAWHPTFSPDDRRLRFEYYEMTNHVSKEWEINTDGTNLHRLFPVAPDSEMQAYGDWTPDGKYFIFSAWKDLESGLPWPASNLWAIRERSDIFHRINNSPENLTTGPIRYFFHTTSLDGKTIFGLSSLKHGEVMRYSAATKTLAPYRSNFSAEGVTSSRNGWMVYVKYPQGELWRSRWDGSEALQLAFRPLFAMSPSLSRDGKEIAFCGQKAGVNPQLYMVSSEGGQPRVIFDNVGVQGVSWSPDGDSLVFGGYDGKIRVLNLKTQAITILESKEPLWYPNWSPDGRYVAAFNNEGARLMLFSFKNGKWSEILSSDDDLESPQWSADAKWLYFSKLRGDTGVYRMRIGTHSPEKVLNIPDFRRSGAVEGWFSVTPEGDVVFLRDTGGGTEIYALSWNAP